MGLFDGVPTWALILGGAALGVFLFWMVWYQGKKDRHHRGERGERGEPGPETQAPPQAPPDQTPKKTLILFRMEGCGPCMAFLPTWSNLQKNLKGKVNFEEYERSANIDLVQKLGITGFPTIFIRSEDGNEKKYEGPRDEKHLVDALAAA